MQKKAHIIAALLLIAALFCAARLPRRDLRATAQVAGIALDQGPDGLIATFEIYDANIDETIGAKRKIVIGRGATLEECVGNILYTFGKELFVSDASVLILGEQNSEVLLQAALDYYRIYKNDRMDLAVFFAKGKAGALFSGDGAVISMELAESARRLNRLQTIKDLMNGRGARVYLKGEGGYEIQG